MSKPLDHLLQKEMSRKEFLATMGFGVASVMGLSTLLQAVTGKSIMPSVLGSTQKSQGYGYGSSPYGGAKHGA